MKMKPGILAGGTAALAAVLLCRPGTNAPFTGAADQRCFSAPQADIQLPPRPLLPQSGLDGGPEDFVLSHLREQAASAAQADPEQAEAVWETLVSSFSSGDIRQILDRLVTAPEESLAELRRLLIRREAGSDPLAAADWAFGLSDPAVQKEALEQIAVVWHGNDPAAALAWAESLPDGEGKNAVIISLGCEVARDKPLAALRLAATLRTTEERDVMIVHGVRQWAANDPAAAAAWAARIPDEALRRQAVSSVCTAWAEKNSIEAATFVLNHLPPGAEQDRAVVSIVQRWAQTSPQASAEWIGQFPDIPLRHIALQNAVAIWTRQDLDAPIEWLRQLPAGDWRDEFLSVLAETVAPQSYQSAQLWASAVGNESRRALCRQAISRFAPSPVVP
jgi:hypothetical protein